METDGSTSRLDDQMEPDRTGFTNSDLSPTKLEQRTFSSWDMVSFWIGIVISVPIYYLAGSLVDLGMSWQQAIVTVVAANTIVAFVLCLNGHPGTKYGIPFTVLARSSFGIQGAHVPTCLRALVSCCWFGIETSLGGQAIFLLLPSSLKKTSIALFMPWLGASPLEFTCFMAVSIVQLLFIWKGINGIRKLEKYSAPVLIALTFWLLAWAYFKAGGFGNILSLPSRLSPAEFRFVFFPSLTANIGLWAMASSISDVTRFAKTQKDQMIGHAGLPIYMGAFTFVGVAVSSSTEVIFGRVISNPVELLGHIGGFFTMFVGILGITLVIITTNVACNVIAPANFLISLFPSKFNFRTGALVISLVGLVAQPWRFLQSTDGFVNTWLLGCSALIGPIEAIVITDYHLLRQRNLDVDAIYSTSRVGIYYYCGGYNLVAIASLVVGFLPLIPGFLHKVGILSCIWEFLIFIYNIGWFIGFFSAGSVYWILSTLIGTPELSESRDPLLPIVS